MENYSKNLIAAAYLSGVGEAFKKSKLLPQNDLENYIEDAKLLRREFIKRSRNDGYENPIDIIESSKKNAIDTLPKQNINRPNSRNLNIVDSPSIVTNSPNINIIEPVAPITNVSPVSPITNISPVSPITNISPVSPITNISPVSPITNISPVSPITNSASVLPPTSLLTETPKVNNAIASLELVPAPVPAPEEKKKLFPFLPFGGASKRKMRKTKKSKRKAKKHTRRFR
uniref:Uncharacterized protein n=1 Tax=viral metagenome TaxID=1070528 RepID=A0A6C0D8Y1_9ZZZZ